MVGLWQPLEVRWVLWASLLLRTLEQVQDPNAGIPCLAAVRHPVHTTWLLHHAVPLTRGHGLAISMVLHILILAQSVRSLQLQLLLQPSLQLQHHFEQRKMHCQW
jgi:hypothetical protein